MVRALRDPQSGLFARIHLAAQFRTVSYSSVSAPAAILVLWPNRSTRAPALDRAAVAGRARGLAALAREIVARLSGFLLRVLGGLPGCVLQFVAVEATRLYPPSDPAAGASLRRES